MPSITIQPSAPYIHDYYEHLAGLRARNISNEMGMSTAFATLLETSAKTDAPQLDLMLVREFTFSTTQHRIDGAMLNTLRFAHGYWEAKDEHDDLETEIRKKISLKYPTRNTIFEDTRTAVLYQNKERVYEADLQNPAQLASLLERFYRHTDAPIENFDAAIDEFCFRIPELAQGLETLITDEFGRNPRFDTAFSGFHDECRNAIHPDLQRDAVVRMLVQHLLTERLFRKVFNNPQFTQRNVIAKHIEIVIEALIGKYFQRDEFYRQVDYFYQAIEDQADAISKHDYHEKQKLLNRVYERFFQGYSPKEADTHGTIYTPQEIVRFMCHSVEHVLQHTFGLSLSDKGVTILDPCVGTGNFITNLIEHHIARHALSHKYQHEIFCNEIMLLAYYIASMNIEYAYYKHAPHPPKGKPQYLPYEGICFADTLELTKTFEVQSKMDFFTKKNTERVKREEATEITIIIGNPPYNVGQMSENDNNKNRVYKKKDKKDVSNIDKRIRETYSRASRASSSSKIYDAYVKFFRWATDRLRDKDKRERNGIVCFVTNNGFLTSYAFDGMRHYLAREFNRIYHLDLGGNSRKENAGGNVFGIRVGVGITVAVRHRERYDDSKIFYHRVSDEWNEKEKLAFLNTQRDISHIEWQELTPNAKNIWLTEGLEADFDDFIPMGTKEGKKAKYGHAETIFKLYSLGVSTNRDPWVYNFSRRALITNVQRMIENYNSKVDLWKPHNNQDTNVDHFIKYDDTKIKWSSKLKAHLRGGRYAEFAEEKIRQALYRPFCKRHLFYDRILVHDVNWFYNIFPTPASEAENVVIIVSDVAHRTPFSVLATNIIPDLHVLAAADAFQTFPFYTYNEDGTGQRENITDWALERYQGVYGGVVTKWDIFHYVYGLLHHPGYRKRYMANLKLDLPRVPLIRPWSFGQVVEAGKRLLGLHVGYEEAAEYPLEWEEQEPFTWRVEKLRRTKDKRGVVITPSLTLWGIPERCDGYRLGNKSALDWVIDQYQVKRNKRSGLESDPNEWQSGGKPGGEYVARLVCQVVQVSMQTVEEVEKLAEVDIETLAEEV